MQIQTRTLGSSQPSHLSPTEFDKTRAVNYTNLTTVIRPDSKPLETPLRVTQGLPLYTKSKKSRTSLLAVVQAHGKNTGPEKDQVFRRAPSPDPPSYKGKLPPYFTA